MHSGSAQMLAMANSFWPFAYPIKSYDLSLHPAFLQSAYRSLPVPHVQYPQSHGQTHGQSPSPTQQKCDKFSIDAILNRDKCVESTNTHPVKNDERKNNYQDYVKSERDNEDISKRRHQRLLEAAHPYLSHTSLQEQNYLPKHLQSPYKQYGESVRPDKCEKKSSPSSESWAKQSKGKRVRTIFTPEQLERMEAEFERQQYMVGTERYYLATSLNLTEAQVKVWFQNRRIKWRKQHLEQQQAKLKTMDIYRSAESASDSESDDESYRLRDVNIHSESVMDPFQSPKEMRGMQ